MSVRLFQVFDIENRWLFDGEKRLDASFYAKDVIPSRVLMAKLEEKGIQVNRIEKLSDKIFWPGRFKRRYVSKREGDPFLMPSEVIMFLPKPKKFIIDYPENVSIKENWILITRSGSIGGCLITSKLLERYVLSDDLIRIVPKDENNVGYLYAYLNTWVGQAFLTKDQYGSTVKHIEPHHVATIPIPRIPEIEEGINQKILEAHRLREEAQELPLKAEEMLHSELGLPEIDEDDVEYFGGEKGRIVKSFEINASELNQRLDASYHLPILKQIKKKLTQQKAEGGYNLPELRNVAEVFDLTTYKRFYVNSDEGLPILSGVHLRQTKLWDLKYISGLSFYR
ncbi:MAG: restriction endonuclease subunit S [Halobacteriota archaeon]